MLGGLGNAHRKLLKIAFLEFESRVFPRISVSPKQCIIIIYQFGTGRCTQKAEHCTRLMRIAAFSNAAAEILYSTKWWREKTLANLEQFAKVLPTEIYIIKLQV